jgi:hypothetical protein
MGMDHANLTAIASLWPTSAKTPQPVAVVLAKARRQFALSGAEYTQLVTAFSTGLQACELLLRSVHPISEHDNRTFGGFIVAAKKTKSLTEWQSDWLTKFALLFRNRLAHPRGEWVLTPGIADELLNGCHRFIAEYAEQHADTQTL